MFGLLVGVRVVFVGFGFVVFVLFWLVLCGVVCCCVGGGLVFWGVGGVGVLGLGVGVGVGV
ncbi:hypothetical protein RA272_27710, partial [Pseudomonas syringae pv. tagetis]|uniref:hypothetical protein n=1 Tax=Pseudomonas syringae group genomosp. 7 TaxID=251699 RepID=UPI0037701ED6